VDGSGKTRMLNVATVTGDVHAPISSAAPNMNARRPMLGPYHQLYVKIS
jgi:hypothetical protein